MLENTTIRQTSWYLTLTIIGLYLGVFCVYLLVFNHDFGNYKLTFGLFCLHFLSFFLVHMVIRYFLESFVARKLDFIYKLISDRKMNSKQKELKVNSNTTSIDEVQDEVSKWVENTKNEISSIKSLENYRKQYVGVISHELKTPIFTIQGYIHTLLEGGIYDENINLKYLERAAKNVDRLETIVNDLEQINKLEYGKIILQQTQFDISKLIKEVIQDLQGQADEKEIKLIFEENPELNKMVKGDIESVRKVLINLITNSIKYGRAKGETSISHHYLGDKILIEVSDDGIGIQKEHLKHLYDRFYRVDHSRSREQGGSGLGLSIVKHIVEAHDQTINVRSTYGEGSTFGFTLDKG